MALFAPGLRKKTILLFLGQFLYVFAYGSTILLVAYFRESLGWDAETAIQTVGFSFGVGAFGYVAAAFVGEFVISRRNTIVIWAICGGVAFAAMIWLAEGWETRQRENWEAPLYWQRGEAGWKTFGLAGQQPLVASEPVVHMSFFEADAYARWAGARLPLEGEWELASKEPAPDDNLLETGALRPLAVAESSGAGISQLFGDAWEWTGSAYHAYPGYRPNPGALGEYNGKFMSNQYVLRGGSCVTSRSHIRASYRNFFPAHARWQWSGLRLARDA